MKELFGHELLKIGTFSLSLGNVITAVIILIIARILENSLYKLFIKNYVNKRETDPGRVFAISRIFKYIIYFITILLIAKNFGIQVSTILLGSAGLLVGLGLGLQQTFTDLLAGVMLLIEGNIAVGDIVVIDGMVGVVKNIKLRTTEIKTRDLVFIIVPNSKLVANNVTNWSHNESPARFHIEVNVHYKEDLDKVERILLHTVSDMQDIVQNPKPQMQVMELSEYAIKIRLYFFSDELFFMEKVLSDVRRKALANLQANGIEVPYPIRHVKYL